MKTGIHIGVDAQKASAMMPAITRAMLEILKSPAGDDVKKAAIAALSATFTVQHVTLSDVTVTSK